MLTTQRGKLFNDMYAEVSAAGLSSWFQCPMLCPQKISPCSTLACSSVVKGQGNNNSRNPEGPVLLPHFETSIQKRSRTPGTFCGA